MKIELPLETWTELFGFVPRSQLIQLVPHFGEKTRNRRRRCQQTIGDRQFVSFVQFFLHKCGEVTLGKLHIVLSIYGNGPIVIDNKKDRFPLAVVPIPMNVKNFKSIKINNFDQSVIAFLQKFQRNSLFTNVNLCFSGCADLPLHIMTNFVPLFASINSIAIDSDDSDVLDQLQSEYSELAVPMLTLTRVLFADYNCRDSWFCDWLHIPREDGKPRFLILCGFKHQGRAVSHVNFIKYIKKDFLEANQKAVSFFIKLKKFRDQASVQSLTLENGQTQEKLIIKEKTEEHDYVLISRYPMGANDEWIEEMMQWPNINNREIFFYA